MSAIEMRNILNLLENNNNIIGYHGSSNTNITQFSKEFSGKNTGSTDTKFGIFFFTNPKAAFTYLETLPIDYIKDDPEYQQYIFTDTEKQYNQELNKFSQKIKEMFPELIAKKPELNDNEKLLKYFRFELYDDNTLTRDQKIEFKNNREIHKNFQIASQQKQKLDNNIKKEKINSDYLLYGAIYKCKLNIDPYIINANKTDYTQKQYNLWLKQAKDSGNNSLIIKNVYDAGDYGPLSDVIIVFDDSYIKIIDKKIYENYPAPTWMKYYD